ncbi:MAG: M12 family metallo-peptidase [Planctomycetota bacterium]
MLRRTPSSLAFFMATIAVGAATAAPPFLTYTAQSIVPPDSSKAAELALAAAEILNLRRCEILTFPPVQTADVGTALVLPLDGEMALAQLWPHSVRGATYQLLAQVEGGALVEVDPGLPRTYRGRVGTDGTVIAAMLDEAGLRGLILRPDGRRSWIEPVPTQVGGAALGYHVVYSDQDVIESGGSCGVAHDSAVVNDSAQSKPHPWPASGDRENAAAGTTNDTWFAELALDADYEYYQRYGSISAAVAQMESIIDVTNIQYERDVGIQHTITRIIVRTTEPDPYSSRDPSTLLDQFRNHWYAAQSTVARDVAHLFTSKVLLNEILGIAYITGICSDVEGYSLVSDSVGCATFACKTNLTAHELGHNWGAGHCNCPNTTMYPTPQSANVFDPSVSVPQIITYRDTRTCLFQGDVLLDLALSSLDDSVAEENSLQLLARADFQFGRTTDVTTEVTWSIEPPEVGVIDASGRFFPQPVDGPTDVNVQASYTFDGLLQQAQRTVTIVDRLAAPLADPIDPEKVRYLTFAVPPGTGASAIRLDLVSLHHPDPANVPGTHTRSFAAFEGKTLWVGPPSICPSTSDPTVPRFTCARLSCTPYYATDWGDQSVYVTDPEVIPSSSYRLTFIPAVCNGRENDCPFASHSLPIATNRWGDLAPVFQTPGGASGTATQPNVLDIAALVERVAGIPSAVHQSRTQLYPNRVNFSATGPNVLDIAYVVDALKGASYPFQGPCTCPPIAVCPGSDICGRCRVE